MNPKHVFLRLRDPRLIIVTAGVTLLVVVTALTLFQSPTQAAPPPPLTGPLHLTILPTSSAVQPSASADVNWTPIYTETFDTSILSPSRGWTITVTNELTSTPSQLEWEYVGQSSNSSGAFTSTLWSSAFQVGRFTNYVVTETSTYSPWMSTYAAYALDTQHYASFRVQYDYYLDTESGGGRFGLAYSCSDDVNHFYTFGLQSGHLRTWVQVISDLPTTCSGSARPAYVAFVFQSDGSTPSGLGAFVDNLVVYGAPWYKAYLSFARIDPTSTPTLTPTPNVLSGTPVLTYTYEYEEQPRWCQNNDATQNWTTILEQPPGGTSKAYRIWVNRSDVRMESPQEDPPSNYGIQTKFSFFDMTGFDTMTRQGAQWGLIFGVNGHVFGDVASGDHCDADPNGDGYYQFMLRINSVGSYDYKLRRMAAGAETILIDWTAVPSSIASTISSSGWNLLRLNRNGSGIQIFINNNKLLDTYDGTWTGTRWWGFFIKWPGASDSSDFRVNWDDTIVYNLTP
jgi:hypothetical protein